MPYITSDREFLDFYNKGNYGGAGFFDDLLYGLNPLNWFNGDFTSNAPSTKKAYEDFVRQKYANLNADFQDLFNRGDVSSKDLLTFAMNNPEWADQNGQFISPFINDMLQRESYGKNIQAMKDAGINPLVGLGNVGSLGATSEVSLGGAVSNAQAGARMGNGLGDIKNVLMILLALSKLMA